MFYKKNNLYFYISNQENKKHEKILLHKIFSSYSRCNATRI